LLCVLVDYLFWRRFHMLLRRMCIVQQFNEILCSCLLNPFGLLCLLILVFICWFFLDNLSIAVTGCWHLLLSLCSSLSVHISPVVLFFLNVVVFTYVRHMYVKNCFHLMHCALYNTKWTSLSLLSNFSLMSGLSDASIAIPPCIQVLFVSFSTFSF
jgi:hypothetical protein